MKLLTYSKEGDFINIKPMSMTTIKNTIFSKLISNEKLIKSLIIPQYDYLDVEPTEDEQYLLDNPDELIQKQILTYKKVNIPKDDGKVYITTQFYSFRKVGHSYQQGNIMFFALVPIGLDSTKYGSRYDMIVDLIDETLSGNGIGAFEFLDRSDLTVNDEYCGASITFKILDFNLDSR